jgi:hypothetical protein
MTVAELGHRMSSAEFTEWMVYAQLEPFGPRREDERAGMVAAMVTNVARDVKSHPRAFTPDDFFPDPERRPVAVEDRVARLKAWAMQMNARNEAKTRSIRVPR